MASSTTELTKATAPEYLGGSARMVLVGVALAWFVVAGFSTRPEWRLGAMAAGVTISAIIAVHWGQQLMAKWRLRRDAERLVDMVGNDATPCFTADTQGQINYQNAAAEARFAAAQGATLLAALQNHFASPSAVLYRLQRRASLGGAAREDFLNSLWAQHFWQPDGVIFGFRCTRSRKAGICGGSRNFRIVAFQGAARKP